MSRYAQTTTVPIERSRQEINRIIQRWGAKGIGWLDDWEHNRVILQFRFAHDAGGIPVLFNAQFTLQLDREQEIRERCMGVRGLRQAQFEKEMANRGKREHRVLLLWLKGCFEAVEEGLVDPAVLFMPFYVGARGETVADVLMPALGKVNGDAGRLLTGKVTAS